MGKGALTTEEKSLREESQRDSSILLVPDVCQHTSRQYQRRTRSQPTEHPSGQHRRCVLSESGGEGEGEVEDHRTDEDGSSTELFAERGEEHGADTEGKDEEGGGEVDDVNTAAQRLGLHFLIHDDDRGA